MNILFISCLSNSLSTGPAWSVPARIDAQSKLDDVLWVNLSNACHDHWKQIPAYHNISEYKSVSLKSLPKPFNHPDVVVFEGFYGGLKEIRIALDCWRFKVPYIIVPRGSLTWQAMHNHSKMKKELAHFFFYDKFVKNALAIQYLTEKEYEDSKYRFRGKHFILPNGYTIPNIQKSQFSEKGINACFIGRIDIYHKGLDVLIDAIYSIQDYLRNNQFHITIYGPTSHDYNQVKLMIAEKGLDDLACMGGEVLGEIKRDVLLSSDVFVLTSRFEGHPMGLLEALAYGVPCFVTPGVNMRDEVDEFDAGWTSELNISDMSSTIRHLIEEKESLLVKGNNARKLAVNYSWDIIAKNMHDNIKEYGIK